VPVLENGRQNWDTAHASFMAVVYLDFIYNAPVTSVLANSLAQEMYRRREHAEVLATLGDDGAARARTHESHLRHQANRWQFLFSVLRNPALAAKRVLPPTPLNPWDEHDDALGNDSGDEGLLDFSLDTGPPPPSY
jgi:hypothetical protein